MPRMERVMTEPMDRIESEALRLAAADRARLARLLLESLDVADDQEQVAAAWEAEVTRRVAEFRNGGIATSSATAVFSEARWRIQRG
jgi:putative addiction module component (TIGR02574 family)